MTTRVAATMTVLEKANMRMAVPAAQPSPPPTVSPLSSLELQLQLQAESIFSLVVILVALTFSSCFSVRIIRNKVRNFGNNLIFNLKLY